MVEFLYKLEYMQHFPLKEKLHTDVLEGKYGPIEAQVLRHDKRVRMVHLIDKKGVSRTFALTFFPEKFASKEIELINLTIRNGQPIGKAFREYGYIVRKNVYEVYVIELPDWLKKAFKTKSNYAKARISEFYAKKKGGKPTIYGTVVEIYSPDFRAPMVNKHDIAQFSASTKSFKKFGVGMFEIWRMIGQENNYQGLGKKYDEARNDTIKLVFEFKKRIQRYLKSQK